MRRSRTDQKSGSWSHMEVDLTNKNLQRTKNSSCRRIRYRSNSFNAFLSQQSEQMAGTIQLFYLYEDKNSRNMCNLDKSKEGKKSQTVERIVDEIRLSFIDRPIGHVKIKNLGNWDFNIFHLKRASSNYTIRDIGLQIMNEYDLFQKLKLNYFMMARIFSSIEAAYHNFNPYHTALHAADVLQAVHCFISQSQLLTILSPTEIFASLLAAALHDADHPGVNQSYLEKTGDFLVDLYKSVSVLEKHHAKFGLCILQENGLSNALELHEWEFVRDCFLKLIPATDITYQGVYQKQFKDLTNYHMANPSLPFTISDRLLIMQMALKCSDISNPCRIWPICKEWAIRVCCELFCQGDRERFQWSLQPIPTMDRTKFTLARIQIGFIRDMVKPLLTGWHEFLQNNLTLKILQNLDENLKNWLTDLSLSSSASSSSGMTNYVNRHNSLDSQLLSTLPLSNNNNQSISSNQIKQKTIKSEISDQKSKIDIQRPFIGSIHLTHSPIQEIETMNAPESFDSTTTTNNNNLHSGKLYQTIFITTRVIRRHSLPETQLAIRKTFNFSLSNKSSTVVLLKNDTQNILSLHSRNNNNLPVGKIKSQSSTFKSPSSLSPSSTCTVSANLLQMLYEELKHNNTNNNKSNYVLSKIDIKSIPNTSRYKDNKLLEQKVLDLNCDRTLLRFSALAHRRSSAPITEH